MNTLQQKQKELIELMENNYACLEDRDYCEKILKKAEKLRSQIAELEAISIQSAEIEIFYASREVDRNGYFKYDDYDDYAASQSKQDKPKI